MDDMAGWKIEIKSLSHDERLQFESEIGGLAATVRDEVNVSDGAVELTGDFAVALGELDGTGAALEGFGLTGCNFFL